MSLQVQGLGKRFGALSALSGVDLALGPAELLVVLGPTGAGKTTLLRCLAGLETPDSGRIRWQDSDITAWEPARRDVALVFQNFSLYPRMTVGQNLAFPLRAPGRRLAKAEITRRVTEAAGLLRLTALLDRPASRLSGGEMQRVAIGRAIVREPRLFLMDEPLTNLDAKLRERLRLEIVRLQRRLGRPLVYVTHDQAEALGMADRIAVLVEGRIRQVGTPEEVYRRPVDSVVARQLGQPPINLLPRPGGGWRAIRPEHVRLQGGARPGRILVVEDLGPHRVVLIEQDGRQLHALVTDARCPIVGDTVHPLWDDAQELQLER